MVEAAPVEGGDNRNLTWRAVCAGHAGQPCMSCGEIMASSRNVRVALRLARATSIRMRCGRCASRWSAGGAGSRCSCEFNAVWYQEAHTRLHGHPGMVHVFRLGRRLLTRVGSASTGLRRPSLRSSPNGLPQPLGPGDLHLKDISGGLPAHAGSPHRLNVRHPQLSPRTVTPAAPASKWRSVRRHSRTAGSDCLSPAEWSDQCAWSTCTHRFPGTSRRFVHSWY